MKSKNLWLVLVVVLIALGGYYFYQQKNNQVAINQNTNVNDNAPLFGGDRDEHGCIGSAGYSWCEAKSKCLRVWEEDCASLEKISQALALKEGKEISGIYVSINKETADYASGRISFTPQGGEGGVWLAAKVADQWQIVYSGNGSIDCPGIKANYQFPEEMLVGFCD